jgi:uncharacterized membrane protein
MKANAMQIQASIIVNRPATVVFPYLTNVDKLIGWQTFLAGAEPLSDGAIGVGSKFRNILRHPGFNNYDVLTLEIIGEVLIFEANKRLKVEGSSNISDLTIDYRLSETDSKTTVQQIADFQLRGFLLRPVEGLMSGFLEEQFQKDLQNLKQLVEKEQPLAKSS